MADAGEQTNLEQLTSETDVRLTELEDSKEILRSFAAFGVGFLAARIAIGLTRLAFGLDKNIGTQDVQELFFSVKFCR